MKSVPYNINSGKMNITGLRDLINGEKLQWIIQVGILHCGPSPY